MAGLKNGQEAPSPRETPEIEVEAESNEAPLYDGDLPRTNAAEEPAAPLRPAGTNPVNSDREGEESANADSRSLEQSLPPLAARE